MMRLMLEGLVLTQSAIDLMVAYRGERAVGVKVWNRASKVN